MFTLSLLKTAAAIIVKAPSLPKNIKRMIIAFPATEREVVIPAVRPAAVIAETT